MQGSVEDARDTASSWESASEPDQQHQHAQQQFEHAAVPPHVASCSHDHQSPSCDQHDDTNLQYTSSVLQQPQQASSSTSQAVATQVHHSVVSTDMSAASLSQERRMPHSITQHEISRHQDYDLALLERAENMVDIVALRRGLDPAQLSKEQKWESVMATLHALGTLTTILSNQEHHRCCDYFQTAMSLSDIAHSLACICS